MGCVQKGPVIQVVVSEDDLGRLLETICAADPPQFHVFSDFYSGEVARREIGIFAAEMNAAELGDEFMDVVLSEFGSRYRRIIVTHERGELRFYKCVLG